MLVPAYSHLLGTRQLQHGICQQLEVNIVHSLKSVVQLIPLGGTGWLSLLCSPVVVLNFMRPNILRNNLLQTLKKHQHLDALPI